jgi:hypothetical protein
MAHSARGLLSGGFSLGHSTTVRPVDQVAPFAEVMVVG